MLRLLNYDMLPLLAILPSSGLVGIAIELTQLELGIGQYEFRQYVSVQILRNHKRGRGRVLKRLQKITDYTSKFQIVVESEMNVSSLYLMC